MAAPFLFSFVAHFSLTAYLAFFRARQVVPSVFTLFGSPVPPFVKLVPPLHCRRSLRVFPTSMFPRSLNERSPTLYFPLSFLVFPPHRPQSKHPPSFYRCCRPPLPCFYVSRFPHTAVGYRSFHDADSVVLAPPRRRLEATFGHVFARIT